jgi:phenylacetate-CoA ligase
MRGRILAQWFALERSQWLDGQSILQRQEKLLQRMIRRALTSVPHYRALGLDPANVRSAAALHLLPILTKRDVGVADRSLLADGFDRDRLYWSRTSGTSGEPTVTYFDARAWALCRYALKIRRLRAMAPLIGRRVLVISDRDASALAGSRRNTPPSIPCLYTERTVSLYDDPDLHIGVVDSLGPDVIQAYPSYLEELIRAYAARGRAPPRIPWLCVSSELLRPAVRRRIESAFAGRVFDVYGTTEFKEIAWQCGHGIYHVNFESVFVEIVDDDLSDGAGRIVVSTLCNDAMPLLRYATGDRGMLHWGRCACGRESPQLTLSAGREVEMIALPSGRRISPYLLDIDGIETVSGLRQFQYVHQNPGHLRLELVMDGDLTPAKMRWLHDRIADALGEPMTVELSRVERIERPAGSKASIYRRI